MSIRTSMAWLADTNGPLPEYRAAFENAVGHGFSKAVILWDGPDYTAHVRQNKALNVSDADAKLIVDAALGIKSET